MNNMETLTTKKDPGVVIVICFVILSIILIIKHETRFNKIPQEFRDKITSDLSPKGKILTEEELKERVSADLSPKQSKAMTKDELMAKVKADLSPKSQSTNQ